MLQAIVVRALIEAFQESLFKAASYWCYLYLYVPIYICIHRMYLFTFTISIYYVYIYMHIYIYIYIYITVVKCLFHASRLIGRLPGALVGAGNRDCPSLRFRVLLGKV